jgi:hypothetical protein
MPAAVIRCCSISTRTRSTFTALQRLFGLLGENRIVYASSPRLLRTPSIQPNESASSTDWGQSMLGLPLPFL